MIAWFAKNPIVHIVAQSDTMTKLILLLLLIMSIICWALFFYKVIVARIKKKQLVNALYALRSMQEIEELRTVAAQWPQTIPAYFITKNLGVIKTLVDVKGLAGSFSEYDKQILQETIDQTIDELVRNEESYLSVFASLAATAPLIGLFGTVWGLIHAFVSISEKQQADIATVAPGIAEALITTLAGLVVAIPALVMFHYLTAYVRSFESYLLSLGEKMEWMVTRLSLRK
jgi:biopolymer transport protein ExbB/TolQ